MKGKEIEHPTTEDGNLKDEGKKKQEDRKGEQSGKTTSGKNKRKGSTPTKLTKEAEQQNKKQKINLAKYKNKYNVCQAGCGRMYDTRLVDYLKEGQRLYGRECVECGNPLDKKSTREFGVQYCENVTGVENQQCERVVCGLCNQPKNRGSRSNRAQRNFHGFNGN